MGDGNLRVKRCLMVNGNFQAHVHLVGINGIGLSMVIPSGQSMVADYYPEERRGAAFGALYLTGAIGAMLGALSSPFLIYSTPSLSITCVLLSDQPQTRAESCRIFAPWQ